MRTDARGVTLCQGGSVAALLGLLLLATAATTQSAAIHGAGHHAATQGTPPPADTQSNVHHESPARSAALGGSGASLFNLCAIKVKGAPPPPEMVQDLDPLHKYLLPTSASSYQRQAWTGVQQLGPMLPEGCHNVGRVGHKTLRCTGANITQIPDLSLERNVDSLVLVETGIQVVRDVRHLPRSVSDLTFSHGPLVTFNGLRFYQISGLHTLSLEHNTLNTWSFVTAFYSPDAPKNASIQSLYLQHNLITYPVSFL